jgi:hypothetical protein
VADMTDAFRWCVGTFGHRLRKGMRRLPIRQANFEMVQEDTPADTADRSGPHRSVLNAAYGSGVYAVLES